MGFQDVDSQIIASQRHLFDIPAEVSYFNMAYNSPQLNETKIRLIEAAGAKSHPWNRKVDDFFKDAETIRILASDILGATPDYYAITPSASYGASMAARLVEPLLNAKDRIIVIGEEFPSNYFPWQRVADEKGATLTKVTLLKDEDWTSAILREMDSAVKVVVTSHSHWTNGAYVDLEKIGMACRNLGAALAIDATQSWGASPLPLERIQPDFVYAGGYKWLLFPYGVGLLYVSEKWHQGRPLEESWLGRDNARDFVNLTRYSDQYMPGARRFDMGEKCQALLPGAIAALEQLKEWRLERITASLRSHNQRIGVILEETGFVLPPMDIRSPHMLGALIPKHYEGNLVAELAAKKIFVSQRGNSIRFSPYLYIEENDMQKLKQVLRDILG